MLMETFHKDFFLAGMICKTLPYLIYISKITIISKMIDSFCFESIKFRCLVHFCIHILSFAITISLCSHIFQYCQLENCVSGTHNFVKF